jgi:hypothetical protein
VPFKEARGLFNDHVRNLADGAKDSKERRRTAGERMDLFLARVSEHRGSRGYQTRATACGRFGAFEVGCWAHLRRDFQALIDREGPGRVVGERLLSCAADLFYWWQLVRDGTPRRSTPRQHPSVVRVMTRDELAAGQLRHRQRSRRPLRGQHPQRDRDLPATRPRRPGVPHHLLSGHAARQWSYQPPPSRERLVKSTVGP